MIKITKNKLSASLGSALVVALITSPAIVSAASQSANTTITATINDVISISSTGSVGLSLTPTAGGVVTSGSDTVSVSTNRTAGYNLTLADADATTTLTSGSNTITANGGTYAAPTALTNGKWGYAVAGGNFDATYSTETNNTSSTSKWAGVPASGSAQTLKTTATTAANDTTTVWYAARVNSSQPGGSYTDSVTYTATTN